MKLAQIIVCALFCQGCSFAPISTSTTGKTLGRGNVEFQGGASAVPYSYYGRVSYGLHDQWDVGGVFETGYLGSSTGITSKFGLIQDNPFNVSIDGSVGFTEEGYYYYIASTLSKHFRQFEPYVAARYNRSYLTNQYDFSWFFVKKTQADIKDYFEYGQFSLGLNYHLSNGIAVFVDGHHLTDLGTVIGIGMKYKMPSY